YVSALPYRDVINDVVQIRNTALLTLVCSLLAGFLFSLLFAYRSSLPLQDMTKVLKEFWGNHSNTGFKLAPIKRDDQFSYLHGSIRHLITDHQYMQDKLRFQSDTLSKIALDRLLKGEIDGLTSIREHFPQLLLDADNSLF